MSANWLIINSLTAKVPMLLAIKGEVIAFNKRLAKFWLNPSFGGSVALCYLRVFERVCDTDRQVNVRIPNHQSITALLANVLPGDLMHLFGERVD